MGIEESGVPVRPLALRLCRGNLGGIGDLFDEHLFLHGTIVTAGKTAGRRSGRHDRAVEKVILPEPRRQRTLGRLTDRLPAGTPKDAPRGGRSREFREFATRSPNSRLRPPDTYVFDFALLVTVVCFVSDVSALLCEAHRVLKPSGHLINAFIDLSSPLGQTYEARRATHTFYRHARFHSASEVLADTRKVGFDVRRVRQTIRGLPGGPACSYEVHDGYGEGAFVVIDAAK